MHLYHSIKMNWDKTKINIDVIIFKSMRFLINFYQKKLITNLLIKDHKIHFLMTECSFCKRGIDLFCFSNGMENLNPFLIQSVLTMENQQSQF